MLSFFSISGLSLLDGSPMNHIETGCELCSNFHGTKLQNGNNSDLPVNPSSHQNSLEITDQSSNLPDPHLKLRNTIRSWLLRMHLKQSIGKYFLLFL